MKPPRTCPRCSTQVQPGASFCSACGSPITNQRSGSATHSGAPQPSAGHNSGIMGVSSDRPQRAAGQQQQGSEEPVPAPLSLANASAGKRLGAKLLDTVPPLILSVVAALLAFGQFTGTATTSSEMLQELTSLALFSSTASLLSLAYWIWLWGWEATRGNTIGNAILGIRTTNLEGFRAGWGSIFVRGLIIWLASLVLLVGAVIVLISNLWDKNGRRQGWHDKAAKTFVFDIRAGRNPLQTGGVSGPASFAPAPPPPVLQPVASPLAGARGGAAAKGPHEQTTGPGPDAPPTTQPLSDSMISSIPGFAPERSAVAPDEHDQAAHPDDDVEATRITRRAAGTAVRLRFDDGREVDLRSVALVGRNPAGRTREAVDQLIEVPDQGRSVSKTHLHLRAETAGVLVTDRNSTNGSAISTPDGTRTELSPGEATRADAGTTVHFGDRSFLVETA